MKKTSTTKPNLLQQLLKITKPASLRAGILLAIASVAMAPHASAQSWAWSKSAGGTGSDNGVSMAIDATGNVYVAGWFSSASITFGSTTLNQPGMYVTKYDPNGNVLWAKCAGATGSSDARGIAADASGNIYVVGNFSSPSITFGATTLTSAGGGDMYIVKYDASGTVLWANGIGGTGADAAQSVAVDGLGNVVVAGWFSSSVLAIGTTTLTNAGNSDVALLKYNASGVFVWGHSYGDTGDDHPTSVKADATGNVYMTGYYASSIINFGSTTLSNGGGLYDMFVVRCTNTGSISWAKGAGGNGDDEAQSVAIDGSGNAYVAGVYTSLSITFGSVTLANTGLAVFDLYLTKYDATGNVLWAKRGNGTDNDEAYSVATDAAGNAYICGGYGSPTLSLGPITLNNASSGHDDAYVAKYDGLGNAVWAKNIGGPADDYAYCIAVDGSGNVYVTGSFDSPLPIGSLPALANAGANDIFVAKLTSTTGIEESSMPGAISLYPNPATKTITISNTCAINNVMINNAMGQQVLSLSVNANTAVIDIDRLPTGLYFVSVDNEKVYSFNKY